jgi:hypothetical protein
VGATVAASDEGGQGSVGDIAILERSRKINLAFHAAVEQYPRSRLTLRQGARVILKYPE